MRSLCVAIDTALDIYCWILVTSAVLQLLVGFKTVDVRNPYIAPIRAVLEKITAPALWPFRSITPDLGAIDISPVALISAIIVLRYALARYVFPKLI